MTFKTLSVFQIHFVINEDAKLGLVSPAGKPEIEEDKRLLCVEKYLPSEFWNYMSCRAKNISSTWWEDCLPPDVDTGVITKCARSKEGSDLLEKNISLNAELKLLYGPAYLINNQEIYGGKGAPTRNELKAIIKR